MNLIMRDVTFAKGAIGNAVSSSQVVAGPSGEADNFEDVLIKATVPSRPG